MGAKRRGSCDFLHLRGMLKKVNISLNLKPRWWTSAPAGSGGSPRAAAWGTSPAGAGVLLLWSLCREPKVAAPLPQGALRLMIAGFQGWHGRWRHLPRCSSGRGAGCAGGQKSPRLRTKNIGESRPEKSVPLFKQFFGQRSKIWKRKRQRDSPGKKSSPVKPSGYILATLLRKGG